MKTSIATLLCLACFAISAIAQTAPAKAVDSQTPTFKAGSEEVVLDVVVRDKKGHLVKDLKSENLEVFDNGEKRNIKSFRLVEGAEAVSSSGARTQLDPLRQVRLLTLVFSGLDDSARKLSREAANSLLKSDMGQNVYMAVMTIDHKLEILQPFTNNRELLKKAVDRATGGASEFASDNARVRAQLEQLAGPNQGGAQGIEAQVGGMSSTGSGAAGAAGAPGGGAANAAMAQMLLQILHASQEDSSVDWGRTNVFALLNLVKEQYVLPGRKTILFFSTGFAVPQEIEGPFQSVISTANRANVSFYPVDARGLSTYSTTHNAVDALNGAVSASAANATSHNGVSTDMAHSDDKSLDSGKADTQNTLARLAKATGGDLIANANDFRGPVRKLNEDIQTYYEVTYDPQIQNYDGSFRKVNVKSTMADLRVQSRSGYFSLPPSMTTGGQVISSYEVPLLKALEEKPMPKTFAFQSAGMHFRTEGGVPTADIVVDIPLSSMTMAENKIANSYEGKMSYVALVKDEQGQVVKKLKSEIPLKIGSDKIEAYKAGHFVYAESMDMAPGHYTLETAVLDGQANKISARKSIFVVPPPATTLGISSIAVIRSMKAKDANTKPSDPLLMVDKVITPVLNPTVKKSAGEGVPFYVVVYTDKANTEKPSLRMEFSRDGDALGAGAIPLGDPDAQGRIQYVATAPIASFQPGNYQVRFVAKQGAETATETVGFVLEP